MQSFPPWAWIAFLVFIAAMLALDLGVFHRDKRPVGVREALGWCAVWAGLALSFNLIVFFWHGKQVGMEFLTGYLVELSLSIDNVFVFIVLFAFFRVPPRYHHQVLFWGILGAVIMRAAFIFGGVALLQHFEWLIYVLGLFLIYTGVKMALPRKEEPEPDKNPVVRGFRRLIPVTPDFVGDRFFVRREGRYWATPLLITLLVVETTDIAFAFDSIPAILAITKNTFVVFTSNIFAILGLRSFYFALSGLLKYCRFLSQGLSIVLSFIGVKMLISHYVEIPIEWSLGVIIAVLTVTVLLSILFPQKNGDGETAGQ